MPFPAFRLAASTAVLLAIATAPAARAAASYDNCTGFIDSVPATITTQGVWCLRQNVTTAMQSGVAVQIAANNITIDCNDFKIGGLAAGPGSKAAGIVGSNVLNATVRNCGIRGFYTGMMLSGGGHLVENNRLDGNLSTGIIIHGDDNLVRGNRIFDTGGSDSEISAHGVYGATDLVDNLISGVYARNNGVAVGAWISGNGRHVGGNRVRRIMAQTGPANGLSAAGSRVVMSGNHVGNVTATVGVGLSTGSAGMCSRNQVSGFQTSFQGCQQSSENMSQP